MVNANFTNDAKHIDFTNVTNDTNDANGTDAANAVQILDGAIALIRIWKRKLSDAEIDQNFQSIRGRFGL